jgi:2-oxoglutarate ferredoxin oxidoreductase subunit alpha
VIDSNRQAILAGRTYARDSLRDLGFPFRVHQGKDHNSDKILIDGNTASAMGLVFGGCTVVAWYPITPSSSLVEAFVELANKYRVDAQGRKDFAVLQAEDELASIAMVLGAGWSGARAMTATSGPGLSLMSEAAGLAYYAEVPSVIWDVQRVGPSTGLPTRTMQGDLLSAYHLSHGDTKHIVLIPGTTAECFEYAQLAFDLAEKLQTLVIVLTDLDLGMNLHVSPSFAYPVSPIERGKVLTSEKLQELGKFQRYKDVDGDGIPYRTLPGTAHPLASFFTRGTGHDESGIYSEKSQDYQLNMDRLARKFKTAATLVPKPKVSVTPGVSVGLVFYGSTSEVIEEVRHNLRSAGIDTNCLRLMALPLSSEVSEFLQAHRRVLVIEQNRDGQLLSILRSELPVASQNCTSVTQYDGMPIEAEGVAAQIKALLEVKN